METLPQNVQEPCPLQQCVGNCFYKDVCQYSHSQEVKAPQTKTKKPLKIGGSAFTPAPNPTTVDFIPQTQSKDNQSKILKSNADVFIPGGGNYNMGNFGGNSMDKQEYPEYYDQQQEFMDDYDPMYDEFEQDFDQMYEGGIEDDVNYFHQNSKGCDCCKGYINKCKGGICKALGYCHCYASEIEEQEYMNQK